MTAIVCTNCKRNMNEGETLMHSGESMEDYCGDCKYLPPEANSAGIDHVFRKLDDGRQISEPHLMVECYDPSTAFKHVKSVSLRMKERTGFKAFKLAGENKEESIQKAQWATNGTVLICFSEATATFFSLETGDQLSSQAMEEGLKSYD